MNRVIYKYEMPFYPGESTSVQLPMGAKIVDINWQGEHYDKIFVWALVLPIMEDMIVRNFFIAATGQEFKSEKFKHVKTLYKNGYVWHILEVLS